MRVCVSALDPLKPISAAMCHSSVLGPCAALCSCHQLLLSEHRGDQSTGKLDLSFASTMPPLNVARLAALTPGLSWNPFLAIPVFCCLVIFLVLATRKCKTTLQGRNYATLHRLRENSRPYTKSGDTAYSAKPPLIYFPPPPGSILTTEPRVGEIPPPHFNSGALAAQAMAKLWPDPSLTSEAEVRHPWRRHSHPISKTSSDNESNIFIARDADEYFDDADLNGFWRRRTLVFG